MHMLRPFVLHKPVPVALRVFVERRKHDGQDNFDVVADQVAEILVVPKVERPFSDLEMRACHGFRELVEQRLLDLGEFGRVHDLKDVFDFVEEHDLLGAIDLGPVPQKTKHNLRLYVSGSTPKRRWERHTSSVNDASFSRNCTMQ
jgi:hypothetical protein